MPRDESRRKPVVAIFNSSNELLDALRSACEANGYATVRVRLADIQDGTLDLVAHIRETDPAVIVYDLPRPHEREWNFLRLMKETASLKRRPWVLTTTDKNALDAAVGASAVVEIVVGKSYGVDLVLEAIRCAMGARDAVGADGAADG